MWPPVWFVFSIFTSIPVSAMQSSTPQRNLLFITISITVRYSIAVLVLHPFVVDISALPGCIIASWCGECACQRFVLHVARDVSFRPHTPTSRCCLESHRCPVHCWYVLCSRVPDRWRPLLCAAEPAAFASVKDFLSLTNSAANCLNWREAAKLVIPESSTLDEMIQILRKLIAADEAARLKEYY